MWKPLDLRSDGTAGLKNPATGKNMSDSSETPISGWDKMEKRMKKGKRRVEVVCLLGRVENALRKYWRYPAKSWDDGTQAGVRQMQNHFLDNKIKVEKATGKYISISFTTLPQESDHFLTNT